MSGLDISVRPAQADDAADLAILDGIASSGLAPWLWQAGVDLGQAATAMEYGRSQMAKGDAVFGYSNALIAELDGTVAGMIIHYTMDLPDPVPSMGSAVDTVMSGPFELMRRAQGFWYVDGLATYSPFRRRGIARSLMRHAFISARANRRNRIGLITESGNTASQALYRSLGFELVDSRPYVSFPGAKDNDDWLLFVAPVNKQEQT